MYDRLYAIYDSKAERYLSPGLMFFPADAAACRFFTDIVQSPQTEVFQHPEDYMLVHVGSLGKNAYGNVKVGIVLHAPAECVIPVVVLTGAAVKEGAARLAAEREQAPAAESNGTLRDPRQMSLVEG